MGERHSFGSATVIRGDCLDVMAGLDPVDHVMGDPPYEDELHAAVGRITRTGGGRSSDDFGFEGVNARRLEYAEAVVAVSGGWVLLFSLAEGVRAWRDALQSAGGKWDTTLAWVKPDSQPRFNGQGAARGFECAVTCWCGVGHRKWNGGGRRGVFIYPVNTGRYGGHPTEKPVPMKQASLPLEVEK